MPLGEVGSGWTIGYIVGGVVVLAVALLVITLIILARRIGTRVEQITQALLVARENTQSLWAVDITHGLAEEILEGAARAREALGGGGPSPRRRTTRSPREALPLPRVDVIEP
jgi:hypothetical protein